MISLIIFLITFLITLLPICLWIIFIRWEDKSEPEPWKLIRRCFLLGIGSLFISSVFHFLFGVVFNLPFDLMGPISLSLIIVLISAGPIEEFIKYIFLRYSVYFKSEFNQVFDGVVYGIIIALGFSLFENIFYIFVINHDMESNLQFITAISYRAVYTTLLHILSTGIIGFYLGKAKFSSYNRNFTIAKGLIIGILLHSLFNVLTLLGMVGQILSIIMLILTLTFFVRQWSKMDSRMVWRYVSSK